MKITLGIGVDAVDIARFDRWQSYSDTKLLRIFSADEIAYCRACPAKSAERFAVRFAAREALYKALCQACPETNFFFLTVCKHIHVKHSSHGKPEIVINWQRLALTLNNAPRVLLSLTHTDTLAIAWVTIEKS